jgi:hypothetical protein
MLPKLKEEQFAQAIAVDGIPPRLAYQRVQGRASKNMAAKSSQWLNLPHMRARVNELMDEKRQAANGGLSLAVQTIGLSKAWVLDRLRENAERCMRAVPVIGIDGGPTGEYRFEPNAANRALELIGKELGMFVERHEIKTEQQLLAMSDAEAEADAKQLMGRVRAALAERASRQAQAALEATAIDVESEDIDPADSPPRRGNGIGAP